MKRMDIAFPSVCEKCEKNSVDNGNYICGECFYAIPAIPYDDYVADLESGDRTPRGYIKDEERLNYEDDSESSPRDNYEDDGESSPRRYRNAEGSLGCNCSDNEE
jgi:hypothetical protein